MTDQAGSYNAFDVPLHDDLLIEASAGTGKTYALTTLVTRLIVEADRSIDQLLIVTFTISAAGELRDRVWHSLQAARRVLTEPGAVVDDQARTLSDRFRRAGIRDADAVRRLTSAIRDFDRANITTIHGFCQRALAEFALQACIPFNFRVSGDDSLEVAAATRDFWRRNMAPVEMRLLEYAKSRRFAAERALPWGQSAATWAAKNHAKQCDIRGALDPQSRRNVLLSARDRWLEECEAALAAWRDQRQRAAFVEVVAPATEGHGKAYRWKSGKRDDTRAAAVIDAFDAGSPEVLAPNYAGFFGRSSITPKLFKNDPPPPESLFDCLDRLGDAGDEFGSVWLADQQRRLLEEVREGLHHNAWTDRRLGFNALLTELHRALCGESGPALAEQIRSRYPVTLIDEFQDTDRLQADIFKQVYPGATADGGLFVVGDPKQSIYRFRGADVFAYLDARTRLAGENLELKLETNYRSTPRLVSAVNAIFGRPQPFVLPEFEFEAAEAADRVRGELVVADGNHDSRPFQVHMYLREDGKKWMKGQLTPVVAEQTASEIARLLGLGRQGNALIVADDEGRKKPITDSDIAVLVRTGEQGKAVARALLGHGIDSIEMGVDNVFVSLEAAALYRLLYALCTGESEYNATPLLRGALAADLFGLNMQDLARLRDDDDFWADWRNRARGPGGWGEVWQEQGIAALIRHLLFARESNCGANLLKYPDGPRRLTNYLHLTDLLHEAETRRRPSRHGLVDWFRQSRAEPGDTDETAQLRLESDERLVKIVTVHRAKGLEFPIVFCPFAWDGRSPKTPEIAEYFDASAGTHVLDLRPSAHSCDRQRLEEHADELRLLYVALTRAKYRCVVGWARTSRESHHAPLAWLLHGTPGKGDEVEALNQTAARVGALSAGEWLAEVRQFADKAPDAISVHEIDPLLPPPEPELHTAEDEARKALAARQLRRELESIRQRTSYSALSTDAGAARSELEHEGAELPDHDPDDPHATDEASTPPRNAPEQDELNIFTFPSGSRTGRCLHEIFEKRLQAENEEELDSICRSALVRYRIDSKWEEVACNLVEKTLNTPLTRPGEAGSVFRIADIERPVAEMEFHLPIEGLQRAELARCLRKHGYDHALPDDTAEINGFLHGYIDVVAHHDGLWYVMDYKSNWLGPDLEAYSPEGLKEAMRRHAYHLQYLLYITALHRLLRLRLPGYDYDRHIGGAFYLFVRGMGPTAPGDGVFRDRPSRDCIESINACFGGDS